MDRMDKRDGMEDMDLQQISPGGLDGSQSESNLGQAVPQIMQPNHIQRITHILTQWSQTKSNHF